MKIRNQQYVGILGRRIKALRLERNMSQEALASAAGIEKKSLVRIENGEVNTTVSTILALANGLKVPHYEIYNFDFPAMAAPKRTD